ncbi:MAG: peptidyl-prolyl cis-trans isomerase [Bacteroidota bacterium]
MVSCLWACLLPGCSSPRPGEGQRAIARVNDAFLYESDIADLVPPGTSAADSLEKVRVYIDNWIRETLILQKAEKNLGDQEKDVKKQLEDYRRSLITYAYEKALVYQKLDTLVTDREIELYYKEHQKDFELKDNIVKVTYVKVKRNAPKLDKVKQWYKSENEKDIAQLRSYCIQFAENYFIDNNSWLLFDDLLKEIPMKMYDKELFLQNNRFVETADSLNLYFVNIKGFMIRNSISPISFEKENIRSIILNKRKLQLISKMKEDVYQEAMRNKEFEIIEKK